MKAGIPTKTRVHSAGVALMLVVGILAIAGPGGKASALGASRYLFAPSFASNIVTVYDADTLQKVASIPVEINGACCAYATPDGTKLFIVGGLSPYVTTIDVATLSVERQTTLTDSTWGDRGAPVTDDGKMFWASTLMPSGNVFGIDVATGDVKHYYPSIGNTFAVSRDGEALFTASGGKLVIRDAATGEITHNQLAIVGGRFYVSTDDNTLYIQTGGFSSPGLNPTPQQLQVIDISDRTNPAVVTSIRLPGAAWPGTFSPDGSQLWIAGNDGGWLTVVDLGTNKIAASITIGQSVGGINSGAYVGGIAISSNGRAFLSVTPLPPVNGTSTAVHWAGVAPGAARPLGSTVNLGDPRGEIWVYDAKTFERLDVTPLPLPSISFLPTVVDNAPAFVPGHLKCASTEFIWIQNVGCLPPNGTL